MGESDTSSADQRHRGHPNERYRWQAMPSVWWPWLCQLLAVEDHHGAADIDLLALEACRVRGTVVGSGTPFSIRDDSVATHELDVLTAWAENVEIVTILAGRYGRHAWACLSHRHIRVVLTRSVSDLDARAHLHLATCTRPTTRPPSPSPFDSLRPYPGREQFGIA